jgi:predicted transcriptional regulator
MHEAGLTGAAIAKSLGVGAPAVSKALRKIGVARNQDIVLESAQKINVRKLNAMAQLERINSAIQKQLDEIQKELKSATGPGKADLRDAQIKATAEIRKQLSLLLDISRTLYDVEQVKAFQEIVLEELQNVEPEIRNRVLKRLRERRSTGSLFGIGQPGI